MWKFSWFFLFQSRFKNRDRRKLNEKRSHSSLSVSGRRDGSIISCSHRTSIEFHSTCFEWRLDAFGLEMHFSLILWYVTSSALSLTIDLYFYRYIPTRKLLAKLLIADTKDRGGCQLDEPKDRSAVERSFSAVFVSLISVSTRLVSSTACHVDSNDGIADRFQFTLLMDTTR